MAFRAKSSMHLISSSCWLWAMVYSRSPRRCRAGAFSCPQRGNAEGRRCCRMVRGLRKAGVGLATPQRHSAPQKEACFSRPPFFVHCIASSALWGARMEQALELRRSRCSAAPVGWRYSRAVRDSRGRCGEKGPSLARSSRGVFPKGDLQGFSDTWRAYLANASSFWMHGGDMLPGRGAFLVRGPFGDA